LVLLDLGRVSYFLFSQGFFPGREKGFYGSATSAFCFLAFQMLFGSISEP
jgi:hypothetical protein